MMATTNSKSELQVKAILSEARREHIKGRYYIYENYKRQLQEVCETSVQYERAIYELAKILKV